MSLTITHPSISTPRPLSLATEMITVALAAAKRQKKAASKKALAEQAVLKKQSSLLFSRLASVFKAHTKKAGDPDAKSKQILSAAKVDIVKVLGDVRKETRTRVRAEALLAAVANLRKRYTIKAGGAAKNYEGGVRALGSMLKELIASKQALERKLSAEAAKKAKKKAAAPAAKAADGPVSAVDAAAAAKKLLADAKAKPAPETAAAAKHASKPKAKKAADPAAENRLKVKANQMASDFLRQYAAIEKIQKRASSNKRAQVMADARRRLGDWMHLHAPTGEGAQKILLAFCKALAEKKPDKLKALADITTKYPVSAILAKLGNAIADAPSEYKHFDETAVKQSDGKTKKRIVARSGANPKLMASNVVVLPASTPADFAREKTELGSLGNALPSADSSPEQVQAYLEGVAKKLGSATPLEDMARIAPHTTRALAGAVKELTSTKEGRERLQAAAQSIDEDRETLLKAGKLDTNALKNMAAEQRNATIAKAVRRGGMRMLLAMHRFKRGVKRALSSLWEGTKSVLRVVRDIFLEACANMPVIIISPSSSEPKAPPLPDIKPGGGDFGGGGATGSWLSTAGPSDVGTALSDAASAAGAESAMGGVLEGLGSAAAAVGEGAASVAGEVVGGLADGLSSLG